MPERGPADHFVLGDWNVTCSMCGRKLKASEAVKNWQGMYRHPKCNEPRNPQDFVRGVPDIQTPAYVQPQQDTDIQITVVVPNLQINPANVTASGTLAQILVPDWVVIESIQWSWQSGGAGITIESPTAAVTAITVHNPVGGTLYQGTLLCTVTSDVGGVGTKTCNVSIQY